MLTGAVLVPAIVVAAVVVGTPPVTSDSTAPNDPPRRSTPTEADRSLQSAPGPKVDLAQRTPETATSGSAYAAAHEPMHTLPKSALPECGACHETNDGYVRQPDHFLNERASLDRDAWADSVRLDEKCGSCHLVPNPEDLPTDRWGDAVINFMSRIMYYRSEAAGFGTAPDGLAYVEWMNRTRNEWMDALHYYLAYSRPETRLPSDPDVTDQRFDRAAIGSQPAPNALPQVANVNIVDLDDDGQPDILVSDFQRHTVSVIRRQGDQWVEVPVASIPYAGHTEVGDFNDDGRPDIVVADVGSSVPTDDLVGRVVLLEGRGSLQFEPVTLLEDVGRVADARPGDFDQDGDIDFVVGVFGFVKEGGIGWLERTDDDTYRYHELSDKVGAVHVPPVDINGDGRLDFIALISQQHEEVTAFVNRGGGRFEERVLFKADTPTFGSSGIELVDLDQDGDMDILYTNGDAFDLSAPMVRAIHGVQWLENQGGYRFIYHDLLRYYGAYRAVPGDLDNDGDLDIVATSHISDWDDPDRKSIIWLENDGTQQFTPHGIANAPTSIITAAIGDLDGDGLPDVVTGSMHALESDPRRGRVTLWRNTPGSD